MKLPDSPVDHAPQISGRFKSESELCSAKEAAEILRAPLPTIYYLTKNHKLPAIRIGGRWRFRRQELKTMVSASSMYARKELLGSCSMSDNQNLAKTIASAISDAQASQTNSEHSSMTVCVVIVSPNSKGDFKILPLDRAETLIKESKPATA